MSRFVAFRDSTGIEPNLVPPIVVYSMSHKIKIKNLLTEDMFFLLPYVTTRVIVAKKL